MGALRHPLDIPDDFKIPPDVRRAAWDTRAAMMRSRDDANRATSPQQETDMAKDKQVVSRLKANPGKPPAALKKPRPERKPRAAASRVAAARAADKAKSKTTKKAAKKTVKKAAKKAAKRPAKKGVVKAGSKSEQLIAFLKVPGGRTSEAVQKEFGWKPHSARAAISGIGTKKLANVETTKVDGVTVYSIKGSLPETAGADAAKEEPASAS